MIAFLSPARDDHSDVEDKLLARSDADSGSDLNNRANFETIVSRYTPYLRGAFRRRFGSATADELVQELWLRVWQNRKRYDPSRSLKKWLSGIVRKIVFEANRDRARNCVFLSDCGCEEDEINASSIGHRPNLAGPEAVELWAQIDAALSPVDCRLLAERYIGGKTHAELASDRGCDRQSVSFRLAKLLNKIRCKLIDFV